MTDQVSWMPVALTLGICLSLLLLLALLTRLDRRSPSWIRLDWFLPMLRRSKTPQPENSRLLGRWLRKLAPVSFSSNHQTKQRGLARRVLRRLGVSWTASPLRRLSQAVCLLLFLVSFFYVCWPYDARPPSMGQQATGFEFVEFEPSQGAAVFHSEATPAWLSVDQLVFVAAANNAAETVACTVVDIQQSQLSLMPNQDLSDEMVDSWLTGLGNWTIHQRDPAAWPSHYADNLATKEILPAELFLTIDPLVSLSTAIASRSWVWSLVCAAVILVVCLLLPRGFCGYLCPLGTTIDLFDWAVASRAKRFRVSGDGWWVHIKYYLLATILVAALGGVLISGFFAAIPVITRGLLFAADPLQSGAMRGWHLIPAMNVGHLLSLVLFVTVLSLGFLQPRFWCKYVCPSGAVFSLGNLFRLTERKVESSCIHCNKCVEICPFDAIKPDFTTRETDCTMCQSCGGVCPTHAIKFVERWNVVQLKVKDDPPTGETKIGRRGWMSLAAGSAAAVAGGVSVAGAASLGQTTSEKADPWLPVRPPGSTPEPEFLQLCIRCGECFKACPNNVLQPEAFEQGLTGLWTPMVNADWAGCESSCNACGQVCPTGAIRPLPLEEKRVARMGLAIVDESTCLPYAGREECDLCVQECNAAGYHAIEYVQVGTETDEMGAPIEGSGMTAPVVREDLCVGCGLCQTRCYGINVKTKHLLEESAIVIRAGQGREDRMMHGSYIKLRELERAQRSQQSEPVDVEFFVPEEPPNVDPNESQEENPFGL